MRQYKIVCVEGELKGAEVLMEPNSCITLGRDPKVSNLVFRDVSVSRKHCVIETGETDTYYVTDYSTCGITTTAGKQLKQGVREELPGGTILQIGKSETKIRLA